MNEVLASEIKEYVSGRRQTDREKELIGLLRHEPEEDRYEIVQICLHINHLLGLIFARKCLSKPRYFRAILLQGIEVADAHGIQFWLECTVPPLGMKRVLHIVEQMAKVDPVGVEKVLYHLPAYLSPIATSARVRIFQLKQTLEEQGHVK